MKSQKLHRTHRHLFASTQKQKILSFLDQQPHLSKEHLYAVYELGSDLFRKQQYAKAEDIFYNLTLMEFQDIRFWKAWAVTLLHQKIHHIIGI